MISGRPRTESLIGSEIRLDRRGEARAAIASARLWLSVQRAAVDEFPARSYGKEDAVVGKEKICDSKMRAYRYPERHEAAGLDA
jgi:hypothetical protein